VFASGCRVGRCVLPFVRYLSERCSPAHFQGSLGIQGTVKLNELSHESDPARLMASAEPCPVVTVKILKEVDIAAPEWIALELLDPAINGSPTVVVADEYPGEQVGDSRSLRKGS